MPVVAFALKSAPPPTYSVTSGIRSVAAKWWASQSTSTMAMHRESFRLSRPGRMTKQSQRTSAVWRKRQSRFHPAVTFLSSRPHFGALWQLPLTAPANERRTGQAICGLGVRSLPSFPHGENAY
jgi:hypothetical protein